MEVYKVEKFIKLKQESCIDSATGKNHENCSEEACK